MTVLHAVGLQDACRAIKLVRSNQGVVLNCGRLEPRQAQRLIDMVSGGVLAMDGQVLRISADVLLACSALTSVESPTGGHSYQLA